jgi:hypothetical protein
MNPHQPSSYFELMAQVLVSVMFCLIPIALIFTRHQQKMAMILHRQALEGTSQPVEQSLLQLTEIIQNQNLVIQQLSQSVARLESQNEVDLPDRLTNKI